MITRFRLEAKADTEEKCRNFLRNTAVAIANSVLSPAEQWDETDFLVSREKNHKFEASGKWIGRAVYKRKVKND